RTQDLSADRRACLFYQAEDGIRCATVTGVQTCALPIFLDDHRADAVPAILAGPDAGNDVVHRVDDIPIAFIPERAVRPLRGVTEIGRASCRKEGTAGGSPYHPRRDSRWTAEGTDRRSST